MKIGFIGLGKLGLPCAEIVGEKGHDVTGYDVINIESEVIKIKKTIKEVVEDRDIVFVSVPTPHHPDYDGRTPSAHLEPKDFNYEIVIDVLREANVYMNKKQLLVLISTVLPGTTGHHFVPLISNTRFVYNPYFIAMGTVAWDMVNPEMVIIGTEDGKSTTDAQQLVTFYKTIMENKPRYEIGTWDECECIKVFYNTFISMKIGFVNMIQDVAEKQGNINVDVVTNALSKSTNRIISSKYLTAGLGDGGGCHPRDNIALRFLAQKLDLQYDLFDAIIKAREVQAKNMAKRLVNLAHENDLPILLNGVSYKPGVPYIDGSYSLLVGYYCAEIDYACMQVDPLVSPDTGPFSAIVLLAHPELYCKLNDDSIVVDPWRQYKSSKHKVIYYGNTR